MTRKPQAIPYDVEAIRRDFPILSREVYGKPLVYLDNGALRPEAAGRARCRQPCLRHGICQRPIAACISFQRRHRRLREGARDGAPLPQCRQRDEIVFTSNSTAAINTVAYGWGMPHIGAGDEIVLSIMEHHSNIVPWHFIRERQGARLVWVPVDDLGAFHVEDFEKSLTAKTKLVAITHMSNALGTVTPIKEICRIAHAHGIPVLVDGSQSAVHMPIDVQDLDCDWFVFTGHKVYGPSGVGVLYGKKERLEAMRPFMGGGEMIEEVTEDIVTYNEPPHRFEAGTPPIVQAIGLGAALEYMEGIGRDRIAAHEAELTRYAHERLRAVNSLRIFGDAPGKGAIVSFELQGIHAHDVSMVIDRQGVAVRAGTHCAQPLLKRFGVTSTCRASFGMYNTRAEVDALADALEKARKFFG